MKSLIKALIFLSLIFLGSNLFAHKNIPTGNGLQGSNSGILSGISMSSKIFFGIPEGYTQREIPLPLFSNAYNRLSESSPPYRGSFFLSMAIIIGLSIICLFMISIIRAKNKIERKLKESEMRLSQAQEIASLGHYTFNTITDRWTNSRSVEKILGIDEDYPRDSRGFYHLIHEDFQENIVQFIEDYVRKKRHNLDLELRITRNNDQEIRWIHLLGEWTQKGKGKKSTELFGTIQDITEWKKLQFQVNQRGRMDAVGQLAEGIAHDFNDTLSGIIGNAELLEQNTANKDSLAYISTILSSADHASGLAKKLMAFSRNQEVKKNAADIHRIIQTTLSLLKNSLDKRIIIHQDLKADSCTIYGESTQLQNLLMNLILNASESLPRGGNIWIHSEKTHLNQPLIKKMGFDIVEGEYLKVDFTDDGPGINQCNLERIFEPSFSLKAEEGYNLRLSTVYMIVKQHHGAISVKSDLSHGTCFTILLPLFKEAPEAGKKRVEETPLTGKGCILLVEDEEVLSKTTKIMLMDMGYHVHLARNGQDALEQYWKDPQQFDLVILDMMMPIMNGRDCFYAIKESNPQAKVLLISGLVTAKDLKELNSQGLNGFLGKPFLKRELVQAVNAIMNI